MFLHKEAPANLIYKVDLPKLGGESDPPDPPP